MMDHCCDRSGRSAWLAAASAILVLASSMPAPAWGQTRFIRTPADVTAAMGDRIPASWYGYPLNDPSPFNYYGGANYREYYGYGRGYGIAGFPGPVPGKLAFPDYRPTCSQYPETGDVLVRPGGLPLLNQPLPVEVGKAGKMEIVLPADARLWIAGTQTTQTGPTRVYALPPLTPGKQYIYEIRASWTEHGKPKEETRVITVGTGSQVHVHFPLDIPGKLPALVAD